MSKKVVLILIVLAFTVWFMPTSVSAAGCDPANIIFSEIDYDQPGTDDAEFLELQVKNAGSVTDCEIHLVNGSTASNPIRYNILDLAGSYTVGQYKVFNLPTNGLQNGASDGFALVDTSGTATVVWFLSYEGQITNYNPVLGDGTGSDASTNLPVSENGDEPNRSLINGPAAGVDDTTTTTGPTPGAANMNDAGAPNAVTLSTLSATGFNPGMLALALAAILAIGAGAFVLRRRAVL